MAALNWLVLKRCGWDLRNLFQGGHLHQPESFVCEECPPKLSGGSSHIPFRDSKLTCIFQCPLGGNVKTCISASSILLKWDSHIPPWKWLAEQWPSRTMNELLDGEEVLLKHVMIIETKNVKLRKRLEGLPDLPMDMWHCDTSLMPSLLLQRALESFNSQSHHQKSNSFDEQTQYLLLC